MELRVRAELKESIEYWNKRFLEFSPLEREQFLEKLTVHCFPTRAKVQECNLAYLQEFDQVLRAPCHFPTKTWHVQAANGKHLGAAGVVPREFYGAVGCLVKLTANLHNPWGARAGLFNGAMGTIVDVLYEQGKTPSSSGPDAVPGVVLVDFPHYRGPAMFPRRPTVVPIFPIFRRCEKECCARFGIPLVVQKAKTGHSFQGSTVGQGCTIEHIMIDPGDERTEARWANLLYVMVTRAKCLEDLAFLKRLDASLLSKVANSETCRLQREEVKRMRRAAQATKRNHARHNIGDTSAFKERLEWLCRTVESTGKCAAKVAQIRASLANLRAS